MDLNTYQKKVVRQAVEKAQDKNAEIRKLAAGMKVPESEILKVLNSAGVISGTPKDKEKKTTRVFWTPKMLQQLEELCNNGETASRIAEMMGLGIQQVINKIHRKPDPRAVSVPVPKSKSSKAAAAVKPPIEKPPVSTELEPVPQYAHQPDKNPTLIDMPVAMYWLMKLVSEKFSKSLIRVYGSNDAHRAAVAFEEDGTEYELMLEVLK